jgi:phenylpropionate dioxygenase-like ring-hydroxylating dioxygenase large terminal subunit
MDPTVESILDQLPDSDGRSGTAPMLPRACYSSPEFFEFEREAVFARSWTCVGHESQIAGTGDYLAVDVAGEPLLVVRGESGSIHAMSAVC